MRKPDYIALDLETTGLNPKTERVIEIGAVRVEQGRETAQFHTMIDPHRELPERIAELTGICGDDLCGAPDLKDALPELLAFCGELPLLGHHVIFDYSFLKRAAVNAGLAFERQGLDTLKLCRLFMPPEEKKALGNACAFYGIERAREHRALDDARDAHQLFSCLLERYGEKEPAVFVPSPLIYRVKREQPASKKQKEDLRYYLKYHRISLSVQIDDLTRSEVSRIMDQLISQHGRIGGSRR